MQMQEINKIPFFKIMKKLTCTYVIVYVLYDH